MDRYYLRTWQKAYKILPEEDYIIRNSPRIELRMREDSGYPEIELELRLSGQIKRPKSDKQHKYKDIDKSTYESYLTHFIKQLESCTWESAEYYLADPAISPSSFGGIEFAMFTKKARYQFFTVVNFSEYDGGMDIVVIQGGKFGYRNSYRKKAAPIPQAAFLAAFKESVKYLAVGEGYIANYESYSHLMNQIVQGNLSHTQTVPSTGLEQLIARLEYKRGEITARLIQNDTDQGITRASLRGEREGIEFALRSIREFSSVRGLKCM